MGARVSCGGVDAGDVADLAIDDGGRRVNGHPSSRPWVERRGGQHGRRPGRGSAAGGKAFIEAGRAGGLAQRHIMQRPAETERGHHPSATGVIFLLTFP